MDLCCGSGSGLIVGLRLGYNVAGFDIWESQVIATRACIQKFSSQEVNPLATLIRFHICHLIHQDDCEQPVDKICA